MHFNKINISIIPSYTRYDGGITFVPLHFSKQMYTESLQSEYIILPHSFSSFRGAELHVGVILVSEQMDVKFVADIKLVDNWPIFHAHDQLMMCILIFGWVTSPVAMIVIYTELKRATFYIYSLTPS